MESAGRVKSRGRTDVEWGINGFVLECDCRRRKIVESRDAGDTIGRNVEGGEGILHARVTWDTKRNIAHNVLVGGVKNTIGLA
jgi:ribosomal protein S28E/S33